MISTCWAVSVALVLAFLDCSSKSFNFVEQNQTYYIWVKKSAVPLASTYMQLALWLNLISTPDQLAWECMAGSYQLSV